ncbi:hypothetical protein SRABI128_06152 [Microbacterium sp. Bi128]|nr:hypothetical protein SRABI128_06152 [Microbacterium sp. Bi128]
MRLGSSQGMGVREDSPLSPLSPNSSPANTTGTPGRVNISSAPSRWPPSIITVAARAVSWLFRAFMFC